MNVQVVKLPGYTGLGKALCSLGLLALSMLAAAKSPHEPGAPATAASMLAIKVAVPGNVFARLEKDKASGVVVEAADALLRKQGMQPTYLTMSTNDALSDLSKGAIGAATVVVPTPRVQEVAYVSDPVVSEYNIVISLKGKAFELNRIADLYGKRIGARLGYQYPSLDKDAKLQLSRFQSDGEMMRALLFGKIDAAIISAISDVYAFRSEGIMTRLDVLKMAVGTVPLAVAFSRQQFTQADVDAFNRSLASFKQQPEWQNILERNGIADLAKEWPLAAE